MLVDTIKDIKKVNLLLTYLKGTNERDFLLAKFQLNTGLRISDVVSVKVYDLMVNNRFKEYFILNEIKTGKIKYIKINNELRKAIKEYVVNNNLNSSDFLFKSKKFDKYGQSRHITVTQAYRILKAAANTVGIDNFGTHSLRKTWGYFTYKASSHNIGLLMSMFNHSAPSITLRYIGIDQDEKDKLYCSVQF